MARFADLNAEERTELWALLALRNAKGVGLRRASSLMAFFGTAAAAVRAGLERPGVWAENKLVPLRVAQTFAEEQWRIPARAEWNSLCEDRWSFVFFGGPGYPASLSAMADAPLVLYYEGDASLLHAPGVGVVGSRDATREGIAVAAFFGKGLSSAGVTVVSGMAKGIDRAAHLAALQGPGRSVGVLGTGIDLVYPPENADLSHRMREQGLLVSEFPPGRAAVPANFPVRNRIISALSRGVLVVEAAARSGSLITARLALEQGRDVFAVPGHTMAPVSAGCRELVRRGAKPVFTADDILVELAPLLTLDALNALRARMEAALLQPKTAASRNLGDAVHDAALTEAEPVLPEVGIPWEALPAEEAMRMPPPAGPKQDRGTDPNLGRGSRTGPAPAVRGPGMPLHPASKQTVSLSASCAEIPPPKLREGACGTADASPGIAKCPIPEHCGEDDRALLLALEGHTLHVDDLAERLQKDVARVSAALVMLEVRGLVVRLPGMLYGRK